MGPPLILRGVALGGSTLSFSYDLLYVVFFPNMTWNFTSSDLKRNQAFHKDILETPDDYIIIFTLHNLYIKFLKFPTFLQLPSPRKLLTLVKPSHHCRRRPQKGPVSAMHPTMLSFQIRDGKDMGEKMCRIKF